MILMAGDLAGFLVPKIHPRPIFPDVKIVQTHVDLKLNKQIINKTSQHILNLESWNQR